MSLRRFTHPRKRREHCAATVLLNPCSYWTLAKVLTEDKTNCPLFQTPHFVKAPEDLLETVDLSPDRA